MNKLQKISIMIPTFNEAGNIGRIIPVILQKVPKVKILVVDDNSPDGTALVVEGLSKKYKGQVQLISRFKKRGRGRAGIEGLRYALLNHKADIIIEMDADFSHHPRHLPQMLRAIQKYDVVVGSRFVPKGEDRRGFIRHLITSSGNFYIRKTLGVSFLDCTSGYRVFRREVLEKVNLNRLISVGPAIVQEILYRADLAGFKIHEVPIIFVDRNQGRSKFNFRILIQGILMVLVLKFMMTNVWREEDVKE